MLSLTHVPNFDFIKTRRKIHVHTFQTWTLLQYLKSYHTFQLLPKLTITLKYLVGFCYCLHYHHAISQLSCIILGVLWNFQQPKHLLSPLLAISRDLISRAHTINHYHCSSTTKIFHTHQGLIKNSELTLKFWRHAWNEERRIAGKSFTNHNALIYPNSEWSGHFI